MTPKGTTHVCSNAEYTRFIQMNDESVFKMFGRDAQYFKYWNDMLNKWEGICLITFERYCKNHKFNKVERVEQPH